MTNKKKLLFFLIIILLAGFFRFLGLNWDQGQMLHPDERFLMMVTNDLDWPQSWSSFFNTNLSPLNPHNRGYDFFVYGTLPIFLLKKLADIFGINGYQDLVLLGRSLSAAFDLASVVLVILIGQKLFPKKSVGFLAGFFYAISVLPIQLAHFYTTDVFLNFFLLAAFYWLLLFSQKGEIGPLILSAVFLGMAAACKITALFFGPVLGIVVFWQNKKKALPKLMIASLAFFITWRLFQPYAFTGLFTPNQQFLANLASLKNFSQPDSLYPPSVQWLNTRPIFYSLKNLALWGLGIPLFVIIIIGLFFFPSYLKKKKIFSQKIIYYCLYFWPLALFFYQACQFVKPMRYLLPIYPLWSIIGAWGIKKIINNNRQAVSKTVWVLIGFTLIWPLSFISIYLRPHSRLQASNWIYDHISPGSTLSCEYWDDCLPLPVEGKSWQSQSYQIETLFLYDPESQEKWQKINHQLDKIDYLILSSNRLWGSIPKNPKRYPETTKFYQDLFQEKLQFNKVAEFSSLPCFPPGLNWFCFNDQRADESFTVYDHPQVIIYQKANHSNQ